MNGSFVALRSHHIPIPHFVVDSYQNFTTHQTNVALLNLHKMQEYVVHDKHELIPFEFYPNTAGYDELILRDLKIMCMNKHNVLQGRNNKEQIIAWRFHYNDELLAVSELYYINEDGFLTKPINCKKTHFIRFERISYLHPQDGITYFLRDHVDYVYGKQQTMPNFDGLDSYSLFILKPSIEEQEDFQEDFELAQDPTNEEMLYKYCEHLYTQNTNNIAHNGLSFDTNITEMIRKMKVG